MRRRPCDSFNADDGDADDDDGDDEDNNDRCRYYFKRGRP